MSELAKNTSDQIESQNPTDRTAKTPNYPALNSNNLESTLCFPKDIFYAESFDADSFLAHYKREYSLERLRDDLNIFLKVLEMSMSNLINKDYPDFVNLSTNLVDLDKAINDLKRPLETMKHEVDGVKNSIDNETELIMSKLNEKLLIEKKRIVLKLLMNWQRSLKVTNDMIGSNSSDESSSQKLTGDHLERIAFEFCQLKNSLTICSGDAADSSKQNNEINKLSQMLLKKMQELFLTCLNLKEDFSIITENRIDLNDQEASQQLKHVLKSYALLSKQRQAEQLIVDALVKPFMSKFVNERFLESNSQSLNCIFEKVFEFIDQNEQFFRIAGDIKDKTFIQDTEAVRNSNQFDFLMNSVWSTLILYLDLHLNKIFSPADPDLFHQRYLSMLDFITSFETKCSQFNDKDFKTRLEQSHSFKYFLKKWSVQVYFQIRFQEIVSKVEEGFLDFKQTASNETLDPDSNEINDKNQNLFKLQVSRIAIDQIEYCWDESKCFLKPLISQFWKLNLQIISRYCSFFIQKFQNKIENLEKNAQSDVQEIDSQNTAAPKTPATPEPSDSIDDLAFSIFLLLDVNKISTLKLPNFFDGNISPIIRSANAMKDIAVLKEALAASMINLNELQTIICDFIIRTKIEECSEFLKNVNDIARLYRRTNRDIPKMASSYVTHAVQVISDFKDSYGNSNKPSRQQKLVETCLRNVIDSICIKYQSVSSDLLESVKKMEDSLKRLQRVRQNKSTATNLSTLSTVSDDDKIRHQLVLDITEFGKQLEAKFDGYKGDSNYDSLFKLVEEINQNMTGLNNAASANITEQ